MRIEQLEYLAEVTRLGSFRRAAEELHISQPALSESVRGLERELGIDLLERGRHGATVSHSGRELFPYILTVLDSVDRMRQAAGEQHHRRVRQAGIRYRRRRHAAHRQGGYTHDRRRPRSAATAWAPGR